jgi:hypothetical protein
VVEHVEEPVFGMELLSKIGSGSARAHALRRAARAVVGPTLRRAMKQKIGHNRVETAGHTGLMMNGIHAKNVTSSDCCKAEPRTSAICRSCGCRTQRRGRLCICGRALDGNCDGRAGALLSEGNRFIRAGDKELSVCGGAGDLQI